MYRTNSVYSVLKHEYDHIFETQNTEITKLHSDNKGNIIMNVQFVSPRRVPSARVKRNVCNIRANRQTSRNESMDFI